MFFIVFTFIFFHLILCFLFQLCISFFFLLLCLKVLFFFFLSPVLCSLKVLHFICITLWLLFKVSQYLYPPMKYTKTLARLSPILVLCITSVLPCAWYSLNHSVSTVADHFSSPTCCCISLLSSFSFLHSEMHLNIPLVRLCNWKKSFLFVRKYREPGLLLWLLSSICSLNLITSLDYNTSVTLCRPQSQPGEDHWNIWIGRRRWDSLFIGVAL